MSLRRSTLALFGCLGASMMACSPAQQAKTDQVLSSKPGQLFCQVQLAGGGAVLAGVVDAAATAAAPGAEPFVVVATGQTKAFVDAACARVAQQTPGAISGAPVPPPAPAAPVQQVAITAPPNQITPPVPATSTAPRA